MSTPKYINIAYDDFKTLLDVLNYIDVSNFDPAFKMQYEAIKSLLEDKEKNIKKREAYSQLVYANKSNDENKKLEARINYLQHKNN